MFILVNIVLRKIIILEVNEFSTIKEIKQKIFKITDIPIYLQKYFLNNHEEYNELKDEKTICDYRITSQNVLYIRSTPYLLFCNLFEKYPKVKLLNKKYETEILKTTNQSLERIKVRCRKFIEYYDLNLKKRKFNRRTN